MAAEPLFVTSRTIERVLAADILGRDSEGMVPSRQEANFVDLAARIQSGEEAAEEEFVGIFHRRIRGFALAHTGNPDLAEELVQEVLWAVVRSLREGKVQQPAQLPAFVLGTARNLMHHSLRSRSRQKLEPLTDEMDVSRPAAEQEGFERNRAAHQAIQTLEPH